MKLEIRSTMTDNLEIGFADSGTPPIAVILPERFQTAGGYAETRPDIETARLFAAAPDLLSAVDSCLEIMIRAIGECLPINRGTECEETDWKTAIRKARFAICKAERGEA